MERERAEALRAVYRDDLLEETLPFWIDHGLDCDHGGFPSVRRARRMDAGAEPTR